MKQTKGRQTRDGAAVRRVQVMLDEETVERAKALGSGNLSIGLRKMAKEAEMKVITYQAPNGETIDLTSAQVEMLECAQKWARNSRGEEFCSVSHGLHEGLPTYSDAPRPENLQGVTPVLSDAAESRLADLWWQRQQEPKA